MSSIKELRESIKTEKRLKAARIDYRAGIPKVSNGSSRLDMENTRSLIGIQLE